MTQLKLKGERDQEKAETALVREKKIRTQRHHLVSLLVMKLAVILLVMVLPLHLLLHFPVLLTSIHPVHFLLTWRLFTALLHLVLRLLRKFLDPW